MTTVLALTSLVTAAPDAVHFTGVGWQGPPGMQPSDSYVPNCPHRCLTYAGGRDNPDGAFPLLRVHEPVVGGAQAVAAALQQWMAQRGEGVKVLKNAADKVGQTGVTLVEFTRREPVGTNTDYSLFVLIERGGVTLPLELYSYDEDQLAGPRLALLAGLADSVRLDPQAVIQGLRQQTQRFADLRRATEAGYARGERARVFFDISTRLQLVPNFSLGLQSQVVQDVRQAVFLPGGVFLDADPGSDYRHPDPEQLAQGDVPASWKAIPGGFQVTAPDGGGRRFTLGRAGAATTLTDGQVTLREAAPLTPAALAGTYRTRRAQASGSSDLAVFSSSDSELELRPDGRYRFTASNSVGVSGVAAGGHTQAGAVAWAWSYDPASFTLTLRPDGGGGVRSGPTFTLVGPGEARGQDAVNWTVLGEHTWWKTK